MNKLRIRKKIILSKRKKYTYIFISIIIVLFVSFSYINKKISPLYLDIAENEVKKYLIL